MTAGRALDHRALAALGLLTICAYGSWYYAFGVLFDPIRLDTGWSEAVLAASFSIGTVLIGAGSVFGGRLLDRLGPRVVFLAAAIGGGLAFAVGSVAQSAWLFTVAVSIGMGVYGALGFYHVTMTVAVRVNTQAASAGIAVLTMYGAFASVIFLPLAAVLVESLHWRTAMRLLTLAPVVAFAVAAFAVVDATPREAVERIPLRRLIVALVSEPASRAFTLAVAFGGISLATLLVYQVPVMADAGLPLTTAASIAAARGFLQLSGRLPIARVVARVGIDSALRLAFASLALGSIVLAAAGSVPVALVFALLAGFGIGAFSPLQGMKAEELYDRATLGVSMGFSGTVLMLAGSVGPLAAGVLADTTGDRRWAAAVSAAAAFAALVFARRAQLAGRPVTP